MKEHEPLSPEAIFFRDNNIAFADTPEQLPEGDWRRVDDGITLAGFDLVGEGGSSTPLDYFQETFGKNFVVTRSDMHPDPGLDEPLFAVYSNAEEIDLSGAIGTESDVIDVSAYAHEKRVKDAVWKTFGSMERGHVADTDTDVPMGWECIYPNIDYSGAKQYVEVVLMPAAHWCVVPKRDNDGRAVYYRVSVWAEPQEGSEIGPKKPRVRGRRITSGGAVLRAVENSPEIS